MRVFITGGGSGLGAALARAYRADGHDVITADLKGGDLELDVRSDDDWAAALAHVEQVWGGLDVLVNNAGVAGGGRIDVAEMDEWQWITDINLFGVVRGCRTFVPMMKAAGSGTIINTASLAGLVHPAGMASYNAVKAAVVALTETLGHELAAHGITAHAVCPGYFRTNLLDSLQGRDQAVGAVVSRLVSESPVSADDVAAAIIAGVAAGEELILPDEAARAAYGLKVADRASYDAMMRAQARGLDKLDQQGAQEPLVEQVAQRPSSKPGEEGARDE